jgi:hypothetical protein
MVDLTQTLPDLIAQGVVKSFNLLGDGIYSLSGTNSSTATQGLNSMLISSNDVFLRSPYVQSQKDMTAFIYGIFYLLFVLIGAILVMQKNNNAGFSDDSDFTSEDYVKGLVGGLLLFGFALYGLDYVFKLEYLLSQTVTLTGLEQLGPVTDNPFGYIVMAIVHFIISIFFMIRYYIVGVISCYFLIVIVCCFMPYIGGAAKWLLGFGFRMLFSRLIIAMVIAAGIGMARDLPFGLGLTPFPYLVLGILVILLMILILIGPEYFGRRIIGYKVRR